MKLVDSANEIPHNNDNIEEHSMLNLRNQSMFHVFVSVATFYFK